MAVQYKIELQDALRRRGIENAHGLWKKIDGSKETAAMLWAGTTKQIQFATMNKLHEELGIAPAEYIVNVGSARG